MKSLSLVVEPGETVGLVGESGSGKTTIGRLCLGLVAASSGRVLFEGAPLDGKRRRLRGKLEVVLQHPEWSLNPHLRVGTSVAEPLAIMNIGNGESRRRMVSEMLERVGLESRFAGRLPHELSGGQRQRVAIARALITKPRFVVFDEAVSALDVSVQAQVLNLLNELQAHDGFGALFISHDLAAVRYVSDRIVVLYAGEIVESASSTAFYSRPLHPYSRALGTSSDRAIRLAQTTDVAPIGCPLSPRCPLAIDRCRVEKPLLTQVGQSMVACHRAGEESPDGRTRG